MGFTYLLSLCHLTLQHGRIEYTVVNRHKHSKQYNRQQTMWKMPQIIPCYPVLILAARTLFCSHNSPLYRKKFGITDNLLKTRTRHKDCLYLQRSALADVQSQQTTVIPLSVFHRPVTSRHFHLWKQLLSVPLFPLFLIHDPIFSVYNSYFSSAKHVASLSYSSFIKRRGDVSILQASQGRRKGKGGEENCWWQKDGGLPTQGGCGSVE